MELVIKIPEEVKQAFDCAESNDLKGCYYDHGGVIGNAIKNGRLLVDTLTDFIEWENLPFPQKNVFMNAPVIIAETYLEEKKDADSD